MILTDDECRKVYNEAMELPGRTALVVTRAIIAAYEEKLRAGVELPEAFAHAAYKEHPSYEGVGDIVYYHPNAKPANCIDLFTHDQLLQYGDARALAASERGTCTWTEQDDKDMPCTYESSCGEMWSFTDGGIKENRVTYCHHCGGKVVLAASPQEQT